MASAELGGGGAPGKVFYRYRIVTGTVAAKMVGRNPFKLLASPTGFEPVLPP